MRIFSPLRLLDFSIHNGSVTEYDWHDVTVCKYAALDELPDPNVDFTVAQISRGNYQSFDTWYYSNTRNPCYVNGATGCGKTTYCMMPIIKDRSASFLMLQPSMPNCANVLVEYNDRMPEALKGECDVTRELVYASPSVGLESDFSTCTYDDALTFLIQHSTLGPYATVLCDEYDRNERSTVLIYEYFRHCEHERAIFASATPLVDTLADSRVPLSTELREADFPDYWGFRSFRGTVYDASRYFHVHRGILAIALPDSKSCRFMAKIYNSDGVKCYVIDRRTSAEDTLSILRAVPNRCVIVYDPSVQAGITIPMNVLLLIGVTGTTTFSDGVFYNTVRPLSASEFVQSRGRAGRIYPTVVYVQKAFQPGSVVDDRVLAEADAFIMLRAMGCEPRVELKRRVCARFPKLALMSVQAAERAMALDREHFLLGAFQVNAVGSLYKEFGGSATTFVDDNLSSLTVFTKPGSFFIAPFYDMTKRYDPSVFIDRALQLSMIKRILAHRSITIPTDVEEVSKLVFKDIGAYKDDVLAILSHISGGFKSNGIVYFVKETDLGTDPTDDEILEQNRESVTGDPDTFVDVGHLFDDSIASFFNVAKSHGWQLEITHTIERDYYRDSDVARANKGYGVTYRTKFVESGVSRSLCINGSQFVAANSNILVREVSRYLSESLGDVLAVAHVRSNGLAKELTPYARYSAINDNKWLST
uniref:Movement protein n=1 Tax=Lentinula edodes tobamo-like virus 1 TaxID=2778983 RepID=A0A7S6Z326_9VIRU|nr:movement protein [Lentinula edodes tobamo-like virus 1]